MAASMALSIRKCLIFGEKSRYLSPLFYNQERFASRKGKRAQKLAEHKEQKQRKMEEMSKKTSKVPGFLKMDKGNLDQTLKNRRIDLSFWLKSPPSDDVWFEKFHKKHAWTFEQAVANHRETHHPTTLNKPNALLHATIELSLKTNKKTKFIPRFNSTICYPNQFEYGEEKRVVAIVRDRDEQKKALDAGAAMAGGIDIIKGYQSGDIKVSDYDHIIAHPDIITELATIRGLLRKRFPTKQSGNFGINTVDLVNKFKSGIEYVMNKDSLDESFGFVDTVVGRLSQTDEELKENLIHLLKSIESFRLANVKSNFILDVVLWSPPSTEKFYLRYWELLKNYEDNELMSKYTIIGPDHYPVKIEELKR